MSDGYRTRERTINISENTTTNVQFEMSREADFRIISNPTGTQIVIDGEVIGKTPCEETLVSGLYRIKATYKGYKEFNEEMELSSSSPKVEINLLKIMNYKHEFYFEANARAGLDYSVEAGGTVGGFINNVNIEASYLYGFGKSETIYWNGGNKRPEGDIYQPKTNLSGKVGYALNVGRRIRFTPQAGIYFLKLKGTNTTYETQSVADGAHALSIAGSLRFSIGITKFLGLSLTPEYLYPVYKSDGYNALSKVSTKINTWGNGFNLKLGVVFYFN